MMAQATVSVQLASGQVIQVQLAEIDDLINRLRNAKASAAVSGHLAQHARLSNG